jgi:oligopeptide/dipeptide ABC transporter ATP-binding protein
VAVMYAGRIVEEAPAAAIFEHPAHPYTAGLIACTPHPYQVRERLMTIPGSPPSIAPHVPGCAFADRCARATDKCRAERPPLAPLDRVEVHTGQPGASNHKVACWHAL